MAMQSSSKRAFMGAAVRFDVHESDYLLLVNRGAETHEAFAYKFPKGTDLEDFLKDTCSRKAAYKDSEGLIAEYDKSPPVSWNVFRSSDDAAALRKLWSFSQQLAKSDLETLASAGTDGEPKQRVLTPASIELEQLAIQSGMPRPMSDRERPSLFTLTKVRQTMDPTGGVFLHIEWESYVCLEGESKLSREGKLPKSRPEVVLSDGKGLTVQPRDSELRRHHVDDLLRLTEVMDLRARAFHMLKYAKFETYKMLADRYVGLFRATVPEGMRSPTVNEIRRVDRLIHEQILRWVSQGQGEHDAGVHYYASSDDPLWQLLAPVREDLPDQGKEKPSEARSKHGGSKIHRDDDEAGPRNRQGPPSSEAKRKTPNTEQDDGKKRFCMVCQKKHWPRCPLPEGFRKSQREEKKRKKESAKQLVADDKQKPQETPDEKHQSDEAPRTKKPKK